MTKDEICSEHKLIFLCASLHINPSRQETLGKVANSPIDWNKILTISESQGTLPLLYYNLNRLNFQNLIPKNIFVLMENCYYSNMRRNLIFEKEIALILKSTNLQDIKIMPFKGFCLIQTLYRNPGLRIMVDVDILIKKNELQKVADILTQLNYKKNEGNTSEKIRQK